MALMRGWAGPRLPVGGAASGDVEEELPPERCPCGRVGPTKRRETWDRAKVLRFELTRGGKAAGIIYLCEWHWLEANPHEPRDADPLDVQTS